MIRTAASLLGMTAAFGLVLYLTYGGEGGGNPPPSATLAPTPFVAASPTATPPITSPTTRPPLPSPTPPALSGLLPEFMQGTTVRTLTQGPPIDFPADVAMIVATGCTGCDGPTSGLVRVYRDPGGEFRVDELFRPEGLGLGPRLMTYADGLVREEEPYITGIASWQSHLWVTVCTHGWCGGLDDPSDDARSALVTSSDGGITWSEPEILDGARWLIGVAADLELLVAVLGNVGPTTFELYPSGEELLPPASFDGWPVVSPNSPILWPAWDGRVLHTDGTELLDFGVGEVYLSGIVADAIGRQALLSHWQDSSRGLGGSFMTLMVGTGDVIRSLAVSGLGRIRAGLPAGGFLGTHYSLDRNRVPELELDYLTAIPVLLDPDRAEFYPIVHPFIDDDALINQRNNVLAAVEGPFARVVNTGSCLNLRTSPGLDATKTACLADGVLLRHESVVVTNQDVEWHQVTAPDGTQGWAATEFLEY